MLLTKKQQTSTLLTTQTHLHTTQIHSDNRNKRNMPIRERSKRNRLIKLQRTIVVYITVTFYYFLMFLYFLSSKVYFIFLITVFVIFNINNLNVCHRNFDANKNHFSCKSFTTEILHINRIRYNCDEMAEITHSHFDQHYSKHIFRYSMSHSLQRAEENGDNIKFYWINFITSLLFLCKQFYNPKLKVIIIISSLIHLSFAYNVFSYSFNTVSVISL